VLAFLGGPAARADPAPTVALPVPSPQRYLQWHTAVFRGAEDVATLLNCLPRRYADSAKISALVFSHPKTGEVETYQTVTYLDLPRAAWTPDLCRALGPECSSRCPLE